MAFSSKAQRVLGDTAPKLVPGRDRLRRVKSVSGHRKHCRWKPKIKSGSWTFMVVQLLGLCTFTADG